MTDFQIVETSLAAIGSLLLLVVVLQALALRRKIPVDPAPIERSLERVESVSQRVEQDVHQQIAVLSAETAAAMGAAREEVRQHLDRVGDNVTRGLESLADSTHQRLEATTVAVETLVGKILEEQRSSAAETRGSLEARLGQAQHDAMNNAIQLQDEVGSQLRRFSETIRAALTDLAGRYQAESARFETRLDLLADTVDRKLDSTQGAVERTWGWIRDDHRSRLDQFRKEADLQLDRHRQETAGGVRDTRDEVHRLLHEFGTAVRDRIAELTAWQNSQFAAFAAQLGEFQGAAHEKLDETRAGLGEIVSKSNTEQRSQWTEWNQAMEARLEGLRREAIAGARTLGVDLTTAFRRLVETMQETVGEPSADALRPVETTRQSPTETPAVTDVPERVTEPVSLTAGNGDGSTSAEVVAATPAPSEPPQAGTDVPQNSAQGSRLRTIIAGSRDVRDAGVVEKAVIAAGFAITEVVSGTFPGVDRLGEQWAAKKGIAIQKFAPDWERYGKSAALRRNTRMAEYADALIAVWDGRSPTTKHLIETAEKRGLKVYIHRVPPHDD